MAHIIYIRQRNRSNENPLVLGPKEVDKFKNKL